MKVLLTVTLQRTLKIEKRYGHGEWPESYEQERDEFIKSLEKDGWNVTIDDETPEEWLPEDQRCEDCGGPGTKQQCPFASEIRGDDTLHVLCKGCACDRAMDI